MGRGMNEIKDEREGSKSIVIVLLFVLFLCGFEKAMRWEVGKVDSILGRMMVCSLIILYSTTCH